MLSEKVPRFAYDHQLLKQLPTGKNKECFLQVLLLTLQCCLDTTVYGLVFSGVSFNQHSLASVLVYYLAKQRESLVNKRPTTASSALQGIPIHQQKVTVTSTADHQVGRMSLKVLCTQNTRNHNFNKVTAPDSSYYQNQVFIPSYSSLHTFWEPKLGIRKHLLQYPMSKIYQHN